LTELKETSLSANAASFSFSSGYLRFISQIIRFDTAQQDQAAGGGAD